MVNKNRLNKNWFAFKSKLTEDYEGIELEDSTLADEITPSDPSDIADSSAELSLKDFKTLMAAFDASKYFCSCSNELINWTNVIWRCHMYDGGQQLDIDDTRSFNILNEPKDNFFKALNYTAQVYDKLNTAIRLYHNTTAPSRVKIPGSNLTLSITPAFPGRSRAKWFECITRSDLTDGYVFDDGSCAGDLCGSWTDDGDFRNEALIVGQILSKVTPAFTEDDYADDDSSMLHTCFIISFKDIYLAAINNKSVSDIPLDWFTVSSNEIGCPLEASPAENMTVGKLAKLANIIATTVADNTDIDMFEGLSVKKPGKIITENKNNKKTFKIRLTKKN